MIGGCGEEEKEKKEEKVNEDESERGTAGGVL